MECRLSYSPESFRCQIYLRIETDEHGNPVPDVGEVRFGSEVQDKRYDLITWMQPTSNKYAVL